MSRRPNTQMRCKIVATAVSLFHRYGFKGVSMDDVAQKAGIKKANLFHYYPSKEDLGMAALCEGAECQQETIAGYLTETSDPIAAMEAMFEDAAGAMKEEHCNRGCFLGSLAQEISGQSERLRRKVAQCFASWVERITIFLKAWQERGYFRKDFDPQASAEAIVAAFEGAMLCCKASRDIRPLQNSQKFVALYLKGYKA